MIIERPEHHEHMIVEPLSREEILGCADSKQLVEWYEERQIFCIHLSELVKAHRVGMGEYSDQVWLRRASTKLGYVRVAIKHLEHRMLKLGYEPPYPPTDPRVRELQTLVRRINVLKDALKKAGVPIPETEPKK